MKYLSWPPRCEEPLNSPGISKSIVEGIIEEEEEEEEEKGESNHKRKKEDDQEVIPGMIGGQGWLTHGKVVMISMFNVYLCIQVFRLIH